jgi:hypothetical protein
MPVVVELDKPANPVEAGFFGSPAVVPDPQNIDRAIVQPGVGHVGKQTQRRSALVCGNGHDWPRTGRPIPLLKWSMGYLSPCLKPPYFIRAIARVNRREAVFPV